MKSEMQSMYDNQVWTLIDPPKGLKTIRCKWVFKKKTDMDGNVHTFKARYQSDPGESHWIAVKNIFKYLRRTKDAFLQYGGQKDEV